MHWTVIHDYPAPDVKARWDEFLKRADYPAFIVSPEYFLEPFSRDKSPFAVLACEGDRLVGVLTGVHEGKRVVSGFVSRPQVCFDLQSDKGKVADCLVAGLTAEAGHANLVTLFTWSEVGAFLTHGFHHEPAQGAVMLDLSKGAEEVFKGFSANRRTNVRKAIKKGMDVSIATSKEEFRAYYDIYLDWSKRKNLPYSTYEVMEEALMLTGHRKLFVARKDGRIIAGVIIRVHPTGMIVYAANSSIQESLPLKPNDVLHWRVIEWACEQGYTRYNLGGAHLFLRKMGGEVVPSHRYRLDRTLLRRYDMKDALRLRGSRLFHAMPENIQEKVRKALGRSG